jgi:hypothetical protein
VLLGGTSLPGALRTTRLTPWRRRHRRRGESSQSCGRSWQSRLDGGSRGLAGRGLTGRGLAGRGLAGRASRCGLLLGAALPRGAGGGPAPGRPLHTSPGGPALTGGPLGPALPSCRSPCHPSTSPLPVANITAPQDARGVCSTGAALFLCVCVYIAADLGRSFLGGDEYAAGVGGNLCSFRPASHYSSQHFTGAVTEAADAGAHTGF